jgi:hypothetical protein
MSEEEKDKLRQAKADVTEYLAGVNVDSYRLKEVDNRLYHYVCEVVSTQTATIFMNSFL